MRQLCALLWHSKRSHRVLFRNIRRCCPNEGYYSIMADTTNATYDGGTSTAWRFFSAAKIDIIRETSKRLRKFNTKTKGHRPEIPRPFRIEFLQ